MASTQRTILARIPSVRLNLTAPISLAATGYFPAGVWDNILSTDTDHLTVSSDGSITYRGEYPGIYLLSQQITFTNANTIYATVGWSSTNLPNITPVEAVSTTLAGSLDYNKIQQSSITIVQPNQQLVPFQYANLTSEAIIIDQIDGVPATFVTASRQSPLYYTV